MERRAQLQILHLGGAVLSRETRLAELYFWATFLQLWFE